GWLVMATTRAQQAKLRLTAAKRRQQIAALVRGGVTSQAELAAAVKVSPATVSRDLALLEWGWQTRAAEAIKTAKGLDLARADRLLAAVWERALQGDVAAIDRVLAIL